MPSIATLSSSALLLSASALISSAAAQSSMMPPSSLDPSASGTASGASPTQTCVTGAHIIVARASTEKPGEGIIGAVAQQVTGLISNSDSIPVVYPATFDNYMPSELAGVVAMKALVKQYGDACPNGQMVLMGYSQGAQVVGDTLVGLDDKYFPNNGSVSQPLDTKYLNQIAAIIMMGDPTHLPNQTFDVGNSTKSGFFPRQNSDLFTSLKLAPKMQSYCDFNDTFCDSGSSGVVHTGYVKEYGNVAAKFVQDKFNAAVAAAGNSSSPTPTSGGGDGGAGSTNTPSATPSKSAAAPAGPKVADGVMRAVAAMGGAVMVAAAAFA